MQHDRNFAILRKVVLDDDEEGKEKRELIVGREGLGGRRAKLTMLQEMLCRGKAAQCVSNLLEKEK